MRSAVLRCAAVAMFLLGSLPCLAQTRQVRVAVVTDGPASRAVFPASLIEREVDNIAGGDVKILLPQDKRFAGDWSLNSVAAALDRALLDKDVDVVLTLGVLASHEAGQRAALRKPVIAPVVIDARLQGFPLQGGKSGRQNLAYVADFQSVDNEVRTFHRLVGFKHLVALVDASLMSALPQLNAKAVQLSRELNVRISMVPTGNDVPVMLAAVPADADAVYVTGIRLSIDELRDLARGLNERHLPTFSALGRSDLDAGLLMTTGGAQRDVERLARRVVLMIQRIGQGESAGDFDVGFVTERRLTINMGTARLIGFSPRWQDLADAEQVNAEPLTTQPALTLLDAMRAALQDNPALAASRERLASSGDDVRIARSTLLPSLDASLSKTRIDADRASPLTQAENTTSGGLTLQTPIYSERAWANYSISRSLNEAARQGERQDMLDTLESAASAYLDVLRAKAVEAVRRSSVENTRKNLETSRVREAVGLAERSDYLRWVAELARDKQDLLAAEANRRQAETELARVIHRPPSSVLATAEADLSDPLQLIASPRMQAFVDTPAKWAVFTEYAVHTALEQSSELGQASALIEARRRAATASRRAYYLPDISIVSKGSDTLQKGGAGSTSFAGTPDDESWSVSLQAGLPIFTGGRRRAELSQARHEVRAAEADRADIEDAVQARARAALHRTASSYPSIELSGTAETSARENLAMVTEAYALGAVSVTELIDAQDTELSAGLAAVDARYSFLSDFVAVLRAMSQFDILLEPDSREAWLRKVDQWFRDHPPSLAQ